MNYENWIGYRYLIATKGRFLRFLHFISVAGVALGVAALIVVIGVMEGFGNNLRDKIIGSTPHVMIERETGIRDYDRLITEMEGMEGVTGGSPYVQGNLFVESTGQALTVVARGIRPETEPKITKVNQYLRKGDLQDLTEDGIMIGKELARFFGYQPGDTLTLISPGSGIAGQGWRYHLVIKGVFETGMVEYDKSLVLLHLRKAQEIFQLGEDHVSGIGLKLSEPTRALEIKKNIYDHVGFSYIVKTWIDLNRNLFEALFLEKLGLFIILTLMVLVASFNIVSTLVVTVSTKVHDIGILQSIGVPKRSIRKIFMRQGLLIGSFGTLVGVLMGVAICYILRTYIQVPEEIYSIDRVPVDIQLMDVLIIVGSAIGISFLATLYPAVKAAQLQPVDALRYE